MISGTLFMSVTCKVSVCRYSIRKKAFENIDLEPAIILNFGPDLIPKWWSLILALRKQKSTLSGRNRYHCTGSWRGTGQQKSVNDLPSGAWRCVQLKYPTTFWLSIWPISTCKHPKSIHFRTSRPRPYPCACLWSHQCYLNTDLDPSTMSSGVAIFSILLLLFC